MKSSAPLASSALSLKRSDASRSNPRRFSTPVSGSEDAIDSMCRCLALVSVTSMKVTAMSSPTGSPIMRSQRTVGPLPWRSSMSTPAPAVTAAAELVQHGRDLLVGHRPWRPAGSRRPRRGSAGDRRPSRENGRPRHWQICSAACADRRDGRCPSAAGRCRSPSGRPACATRSSLLRTSLCACSTSLTSRNISTWPPRVERPLGRIGDACTCRKRPLSVSMRCG